MLCNIKEKEKRESSSFFVMLVLKITSTKNKTFFLNKGQKKALKIRSVEKKKGIK